MRLSSSRALCCLAFFHLLLCSVFKVQVEEYTLKIEQCKNQSHPAFAVLRLLNELGAALRAPQ